LILEKVTNHFVDLVTVDDVSFTVGRENWWALMLIGFAILFGSLALARFRWEA
jgi:uncharacterized membrane protein